MASSCNSCQAPQQETSKSIEVDWSEAGQYQDFSLDLQTKVGVDRIPTSGTIEIIENCNFRCIHCYQGMNKSRKMLSGDRWCEIIDELAEAGTLWLLVTGGEPLLHPDFEQIYKHAINKGMLVYLFTNARLIKDKHIQLFREMPPFSIEVSFYGLSEEMYAQVTGTKNSHAKVIENLKIMKAANLPVSLKSVAFKPLINDILKMRSYVQDELGLKFKFDTKIDPTIYGDSLDSIRPTAEETVALELSIVDELDLRKDMLRLKDYNKETVEKSQTAKMLYRCGAGKNSYYIDYRGFVNTCAIGRLNDEKFDLGKHSFLEVWNKSLPGVVYQTVKTKNRVCDSCQFRDICDICPATSQIATGDIEGRPQYICQHTMMRKTKILENKMGETYV